MTQYNSGTMMTEAEIIAEAKAMNTRRGMKATPEEYAEAITTLYDLVENNGGSTSDRVGDMIDAVMFGPSSVDLGRLMGNADHRNRHAILVFLDGFAQYGTTDQLQQWRNIRAARLS